MDCIFCNIATKKSPADIIWESQVIVAFKDIKPSAPVHLLVVPKRHVASVLTLVPEDRELVADLIFAAKDIAASQRLPGYRLSFNVGRSGGQLVDHLHLHLLGGWQEQEKG